MVLLTFSFFVFLSTIFSKSFLCFFDKIFLLLGSTNLVFVALFLEGNATLSESFCTLYSSDGKSNLIWFQKIEVSSATNIISIIPQYYTPVLFPNCR